MGERMTWEEIQEKYPDQWVGLVDVEWYPDTLFQLGMGMVEVRV